MNYKPLYDEAGNIVGAEITQTLSRAEFEDLYEKLGNGYCYKKSAGRNYDEKTSQAQQAFFNQQICPECHKIAGVSHLCIPTAPETSPRG